MSCQTVGAHFLFNDPAFPVVKKYLLILKPMKMLDWLICFANICLEIALYRFVYIHATLYHGDGRVCRLSESRRQQSGEQKRDRAAQGPASGLGPRA